MLLLTQLLICLSFINFTLAVIPDAYLNCPELIKSKGYPVEEHTVTTEDGYILVLFRIPYGRNNKSFQGVRKPVILLHGFIDSSTTWVINLPEQSLGYILADQGYDVWLPNSRGNTYSTQHVKFTNKDEKYWDFSFNDMGVYDLPAIVDYVLDQSKQSTVAYTGHSQGTTQMFVALSEFGQEFSKKISVFNAYAPIAFLGSQSSVLLDVVKNLHVDYLYQVLGIKQFLPTSASLSEFTRLFCGPFPRSCSSLLFLVTGFDSAPDQNLNKTRIPVYTSNSPAGTSTKNMVHWAQLCRSGNFQKYDYGKKENLIKYGTETPPQYDLKSIKTNRMTFFTGSNDDLANPKDVLQLIQALDISQLKYTLNVKYYEHMDFTWGEDCYKKIYPQTIEQIKIGQSQVEQ